MSTPKFIEGPNTVQTSLYGYDRNKKVQLNNLRGRPIVVLRSDTVNSEGQRTPSGSRTPRKWIDRSNQIPAPISNKTMYPSYAHFHHQYSAPTGTANQNQTSPKRTTATATATATAPPSPKMSPEDEIAAKKVFEKLSITTLSPTGSNVSTDITLLELTPKISSKSFVTKSTLICVPFTPSESDTTTSSSPVDEAYLVDTPRSLSNSRRTSMSCADEEANESLCENDEEKVVGHTCSDELQCTIFRKGVCSNDEDERKIVLQWYDDLIQWRHDIVTKRRFGPPRCHPPPLTVTMIGASRAQRANPFQRIGDVHPFAMEAMDHARRKADARRSHHLIPANLPLPPPHEFMANAKCMEPHLFVEYCYQLTAAAYVDTGLNPPNRRPPIPPRVEPIPEQVCRESICSSASEISSDGEYSDDSDGTKKERLRQKMERHTRRERRLQQLFRRRHVLDEIDEEDDY